MPYFMNADLDIVSSEDLQPIAESFGDDAFVLHCGADGDSRFLARFEVDSEDNYDDPVALINKFCELVMSLPQAARLLWDHATERSIDLGFGSDDESNVTHCKIPPEVLMKMAELEIELHSTWYPLEGKIQ